MKFYKIRIILSFLLLLNLSGCSLISTEENTVKVKQGDEKKNKKFSSLNQTKSYGLKMENDFLNSLKSKTKKENVKNEIDNTLNFLKKLELNGHDYEVIKIGTFIPQSKIKVRFVGIFHGDGRNFEVNSVENRTLQYIVIDIISQESSYVNFVGKTVGYEKNGKVKEKTQDNDNMIIGSQFVDSYYEKGLIVQSSINVSNPLAPSFINKNAIGINYDFEIHQDMNLESNNFYNGEIGINGSFGLFPSCEAYFSINGFPYKELYKYKPADASEITSLINLLSGYGIPINRKNTTIGIQYDNHSNTLIYTKS